MLLGSSRTATLLPRGATSNYCMSCLPSVSARVTISLGCFGDAGPELSVVVRLHATTTNDVPTYIRVVAQPRSSRPSGIVWPESDRLL